MKDYAINNFKGKDLEDLLKAADQWRLPYWDWAGKKADPTNTKARWDYNIPLAFQETKRNVDIRLPPPATNGVGKYPNALYQFTMPGGLAMGDPKLARELRITESRGSSFTTPVCCAHLSLVFISLTVPSSFTCASQQAGTLRRPA